MNELTIKKWCISQAKKGTLKILPFFGSTGSEHYSAGRNSVTDQKKLGKINIFGSNP
jgi:hypothetical protein